MANTGELNIWTACAKGNAKALDKILKNYKSKVNGKAKVHTLKDNHNWTPLFHAVKSDNIQCVQLLLENTSIDPFSVDYEGNTALHLACEKSELKIIELLVKTEPDSIQQRNSFGLNPLHFAVKSQRPVEILDFLYRHGALVDNLDYTNETPLIIALENGDIEAVIFLLYIGKANLRNLNENGVDCMDILLARNQSDLDRKIACFKILYNIINPSNEWRPKYTYKDIFNYAILSTLSSCSLIPYFSENLSSNMHSKNSELIEKLNSKCSNLSFTEIMKFLLLNDNAHEYLQQDDYMMITIRGGILEYFKELLEGSNEVYEVFKNIIVAEKNIISHFLPEYLIDCIVSFKSLMNGYPDSKNQEAYNTYIGRLVEIVNLILTETEITAFEFIEKLENSLAEEEDIPRYDVDNDQRIFEYGSNFIGLVKNEILKYSVPDIRYDSILENTLKKICRSILRREIFFKKLKNLVVNGKITKEIERSYVTNLQLLPLPESLINYLRFIE